MKARSGNLKITPLMIFTNYFKNIGFCTFSICTVLNCRRSRQEITFIYVISWSCSICSNSLPTYPTCLLFLFVYLPAYPPCYSVSYLPTSADMSHTNNESLLFYFQVKFHDSQQMLGSGVVIITLVCLVCCTWFLCIWSNELRKKYHVD